MVIPRCNKRTFSFEVELFFKFLNLLLLNFRDLPFFKAAAHQQFRTNAIQNQLTFNQQYKDIIVIYMFGYKFQYCYFTLVTSQYGFFVLGNFRVDLILLFDNSQCDNKYFIPICLFILYTFKNNYKIRILIVKK